ncbi:MAG: hypothetical protein GX241_02940 [Ruminococcaceae bacterium]|jgi:hypothetical protein|nr:hypothetical protein [Oscillospiraceae bacterium]
MTDREKKLAIIAAAVLLILGIIVLGIKPTITNIQEAWVEKEALAAKKTEMKTEITALPTYEKALDVAKADYAKVAERVYGDLTNDLIHDAVIDTLIVPCGLTVSSFTINSVQPTAVVPYTVIKDETGRIIGTGGFSTEEPSIRMASVTVNVYGTADQIQTFVDVLNGKEGIFLQNTSFANTTSATSADVGFYMVLSETF